MALVATKALTDVLDRGGSAGKGHEPAKRSLCGLAKWRRTESVLGAILTATLLEVEAFNAKIYFKIYKHHTIHRGGIGAGVGGRRAPCAKPAALSTSGPQLAGRRPPRGAWQLPGPRRRGPADQRA